MKNLHTVIVPGVGGSDASHWQTWLQDYLDDSSRVVQQDWNHPVLDQWVDRFYQHIRKINRPVQIVAHSFGCLTTIAALNQYPILRRWVHSILLVAPANPVRFSTHGFATPQENLANTFKQFAIYVPALMVVSENDPWLNYATALEYAKIWDIPHVNQGYAGHINVASGYGKWTQVLSYMENIHDQNRLIAEDYFLSHQHFRFAV